MPAMDSSAIADWFKSHPDDAATFRKLYSGYVGNDDSFYSFGQAWDALFDSDDYDATFARMQQAGLFDDWQAKTGKPPPSNMMDAIKGLRNLELAGTFDMGNWLDPAYNKNDEDVARADDLAKRQDDLAKYLLGPLDMNDPTVKRTMDTISAQYADYTANMGSGGGAAQAVFGRGVADAALGLQNQRQAMGAQLLGQSLSDARQLVQYKDMVDAKAADAAYQNALANYESNRGTGQMIGGILGGTIGAAGGAMTGNPMLAMQLGSAGYSAGAGLGGAFVGGPPSAPVYQSHYSRGGRGSSGGMSGY